MYVQQMFGRIYQDRDFAFECNAGIALPAAHRSRDTMYTPDARDKMYRRDTRDKV